MIPEYSAILEKSKSKRKQIRKIFEILKEKDFSDLDEITHQLHDEVFSEIDCLKCANCCRTTGPLLKTKDIDRLAKSLNKRPSVFSDEFLKIDEDNDYVFKSMPCPFLKEDNYCKVYEGRPNACREYPHTSQRDIHAKLNITFNNVFICPAVSVITERLAVHYKLNYG